MRCIYYFKVPGTGEEESLKVVQSYDDLSRKLWRLEGLPLSISAVQGAHPALRYSQVSPASDWPTAIMIQHIN